MAVDGGMGFCHRHGDADCLVSFHLFLTTSLTILLLVLLSDGESQMLPASYECQLASCRVSAFRSAGLGTE